jgi:chromosomal replication initiation ATPase DnaA
MSAIDPALLYQQWAQYQQSQLPTSSVIPQYAPQYAPQQPQGEFVDVDTIAALTRFIDASYKAANDAALYINHLQNQLASVDRAYLDLIGFSESQDRLIERFLFDRDFALQYARTAWILNPVNDRFASDLSDVYLEIAELSPFGQAQLAQQNQQQRDPRFTGSPVNFSAQLQAQNSIPPLPNSGGNAINNGITMEQYLVAQQQGQVAAARAAALQNPANLYAALFQ